MRIEKTFDVKIRIVYPHLTKNIPSLDTEKITINTLLKYQPQAAIKTSALSQDPSSESIDKRRELEGIKEDADKLVEDFKNIKRVADKRLEKLQYEYDLEDQENIPLIEAQEALFGEATGLVTYNQYIQALDLLHETQQELARRAKEKPNVA